MPQFTYLPHIALALEEPERAAALYVRALGFEVERRRPDEIEIRLGELHLHIEQGAAPRSPIWFALETDDLDGAVGELTRAGCRITQSGSDGAAGGYLVRDPYGLGFYITERQA